MTPITSPSNPRVKAWARLKTRKGRLAAERFLIEGARELEHAIAGNVSFEAALTCHRHTGAAELAVLERLRAAGVPVVELGPAAFGKISMRQHPDGLAGVAVAVARPLGSLDEPGRGELLLVVDGVEKPGNLGAMLRTADAVGVGGVIVTPASVDLTNPNVVRASQGAVFRVPLAVASAEDAIGWLQRHGVELLTADGDAAVGLWDTELRDAPVAVVVGAEDTGLSPPFRRAGRGVAIPMAGAVDSLNASVAAAVLLYEMRRRSRSGLA